MEERSRRRVRCPIQKLFVLICARKHCDEVDALFHRTIMSHKRRCVPKHCTSQLYVLSLNVTFIMFCSDPSSKAGTNPGDPKNNPPMDLPPTKTCGSEDWPVKFQQSGSFHCPHFSDGEWDPLRAKTDLSVANPKTALASVQKHESSYEYTTTTSL